MAQWQSLAERFWSKVKRGHPSVCWLWTGGTDRYGYGKFSLDVNGTSRSLIASRVAYELSKGKIPRGMSIRHKCDTARCCNPAHLLLGDHRANMADVRARRRQAGARNNNATLTASSVAEIRRKVALGFTHRSLADEFGVTSATIGRIVLGENWRS